MVYERTIRKKILEEREVMANTYKIVFQFDIEVECKQEDINNEVLKWWVSASKNLYPLYKIEEEE